MSCSPPRWLKFEEDVEDGGERWSKPYVATLALHSLFMLRSAILSSTVLLDMSATGLGEVAGRPTAWGRWQVGLRPRRGSGRPTSYRW